jgi:uncharacterized protein
LKRVFVDSGGFFALLVHKDRFHQHARALFEDANRERWQLVTTNAVLIESHALLLMRSDGGRKAALDFLDVVMSDAYRIERILRNDEDAAIKLIRSHHDKSYSLCDALSFVVMERLQIDQAIAFDRHFREYGRFTML